MTFRTVPPRCCNPQSKQRLQAIINFFTKLSKKVRTSSNNSYKRAKKLTTTTTRLRYVPRQSVPCITCVKLVNLESGLQGIENQLCRISKVLSEKTERECARTGMSIDNPCLYNTCVQTDVQPVVACKDESCDSCPPRSVTCKPCNRKKQLLKNKSTDSNDEQKSCCTGCPRLEHIINSTGRNNSSDSGSCDYNHCPKGRIQLSSMSIPECHDDDESLDETAHHVRKCCRDVQDCLQPRPASTCRRRRCSDRDKTVCCVYKHDSSFCPKIKTCDVETYDFIPVKQTWSPKSRKKFVEYRKSSVESPNEIPPLSMNLKPRLILKPQTQSYNRKDHTYSHSKSQLSSHVGKSTLLDRDKSLFNIAYNTASKDYFESGTSKQGPIKIRCKQGPIKERYEQNISSTTHTLNNINDSNTTLMETHKSKACEKVQNKKDDTHERILGDVKDILLFLINELHKDGSTVSEPKEFKQKTNENNIPYSERYRDEQNGTSTCTMKDIHKCRVAHFCNPYCYFLLPIYPSKKPVIIEKPHRYYPNYALSQFQKTTKELYDLKRSKHNSPNPKEVTRELLKNTFPGQRIKKEDSSFGWTQTDRFNNNKSLRCPMTCNDRQYTIFKIRTAKSCEDLRHNSIYSASSFKGYTDTILDLLTPRTTTLSPNDTSSTPINREYIENNKVIETLYRQDLQQYFYGTNYFNQLQPSDGSLQGRPFSSTHHFQPSVSPGGSLSPVQNNSASACPSKPLPNLNDDLRKHYSNLMQLLVSEIPDDEKSIDFKKDAEVTPTAPPEEAEAEITQNAIRYYIKQIEVRNSSTQYEKKMSCFKKLLQKLKRNRESNAI